MPPDPETIEIVREETERQSTRDLQATLEALHAAGRRGRRRDRRRGPGRGTRRDRGRRVDGREAIILTRSHVVSEFFHVRLVLARPPRDRRTGAAPARARELRRAGRAPERASRACDGSRLRGPGTPRERLGAHPGGDRPTGSPSSTGRCAWARTTGTAPCSTYPLTRVRARPSAGPAAWSLDVDGSPLLLNFSDHEDVGTVRGPVARARRVVDAGQRTAAARPLPAGRSSGAARDRRRHLLHPRPLAARTASLPAPRRRVAAPRSPGTSSSTPTPARAPRRRSPTTTRPR